MKHGERITFEFVECGGCSDCILENAYYRGFSCTCGHFIKSPTTGPHLHSRFGTDPETLKKVQHIADWYNGFDVPEYEVPSDVAHIVYYPVKLIAYDNNKNKYHGNNNLGWFMGSPRIREKPAFDTRLGKLTDEDARKGNPKGGRVWFMVDGLSYPVELYGVDKETALHTTKKGWSWSPRVDVRLATPDELRSNNIDPEEAGVKG